MDSLYAKFHKALCDLNSTDIGVSFPAYQKTLGDQLRIHGTQTALTQLQDKNWVGGMSGYCQVSAIQPVPDNVQYRTVSRVQANMSQAKLNRLIKRGSITEEEVKQYRAKMFTQGLENPYIELISGSNKHKHRRYIKFSDLTSQPITGKFDLFGLSKIATVPWF